MHRGIVAAVGAAVLFGLSTPISKILVGQMAPLMLAGLLYLGSGVGLATIMFIRATRPGYQRASWPHGSDRWWLAGAIAAGGIIAPYLLLYGLRTTDAGSASLLLNLEGVFTALLAWFAFKENFDRRIALGMLFIVCGGIALSVEPTLRVRGLVGSLAIAGACLGWAIDNNLTRKVSAHDALYIACAKGVVAGATSITLALAYGARIPSFVVVLQAGLLGLVSYGLSLVLFVFALRHLGTARTGAYFSMAPFVGTALAVALGAPVTLALIAACLLMVIGVGLHLTENHDHWHRHVATEHQHSHTHDALHQHQHGPEWDGKEPHDHRHFHSEIEHAHPHFPDVHHRHEH